MNKLQTKAIIVIAEDSRVQGKVAMKPILA